jgi:hypothetical protein
MDMAVRRNASTSKWAGTSQVLIPIWAVWASIPHPAMPPKVKLKAMVTLIYYEAGAAALETHGAKPGQEGVPSDGEAKNAAARRASKMGILTCIEGIEQTRVKDIVKREAQRRNSFIPDVLCQSLMQQRKRRTIWACRKTVPLAPMFQNQTKTEEALLAMHLWVASR